MRTPTDFERFVLDFTVLAETLCKELPSPTGLQGIWEDLCAVMTPAEAVRTVKLARGKEDFLPTPRRLIELASKENDSITDLVWPRLLALASRASSVRIEDCEPEMHRAVLSVFGGWNQVGRTREADLPMRRKAFVEAYGRALTARDRNTLLGHGDGATAQLPES